MICPVCKDGKGKPLEGTLYKDIKIGQPSWIIVYCLRCSWCQPMPHNSKETEDMPTIQSLKKDWF